MKIAVVRNRLIKQSSIVGVVIILFGGIMFYLDSLVEESDNNINSLRGQVDSVTRQVMDLSNEYGKVTNIMDEYRLIKQKQSEKMLDIDKKALRDAIAEIRNKNHLDVSEVKVSEIKTLSDPKYKRDAVFVESSDISITANAVSDLDILALIKKLEQGFSGVKFTSFSMKLAKDLDNSVLLAVKETGFTPMINGKINLTLFGLHDVVAVDNDLMVDGDGKSPQNRPANAPVNSRMR